MKEKILELRKTGKSYKQISQLLGCSKSVVIYHCNDDQKEKQRKRQSDRRADAVIIKKVENFQKSVRNKSDDFQRERILVNGRPKLGKRNIKFHWQDVIKKFGWETTCYLTGEKINLKEPRKYQQRAIRNSKKHFVREGNARGKMIMPCGTGKSLTSYWIAESLNAKNILISVPSLVLLRQSLNLWLEESSSRNLEY
jgi:hypothetical protein